MNTQVLGPSETPSSGTAVQISEQRFRMLCVIAAGCDDGGDPPPPHGEEQTSFSCTAELQVPPQVRLWDSRRLLAHRTYTHEQAEKKSWAWNDPEPQQKLQQCSFVLLIKILASSRASHVPKDKKYNM